MKCPDCGAEMQTWGRGATARKHGQRWVCPVAEREVIKDERGHLHRIADAKHTTTRVWTEDDLIAELSTQLDLAVGLRTGTTKATIYNVMAKHDG